MARRLRLERVPLLSARGILGAVALTALAGILLGAIIFEAVAFFRNESDAADLEGLTRADVWLFFLLQGIPLIGLPLLYLVLVRPRESLVDLLGLRVSMQTPWHVFVGVLAAAAIVVALVVVALGLSFLEDVPEEPESPLVGEFERLVKDHPEFILLIPLFAALSEELLFRGFLQPRIGLWGSNIVFGLLHASYGTVLQVVIPFALGLVFGILYRRWKSLWVPMAAHFAYDVAMLGILALRPSDAANPGIAFF